MSENDPQKFTQDVISWFNQAYYFHKDQTWFNTHWHGIPVHKTPTDLWVYQEILHETRPTLIIETGTAKGGSALYLAQIAEQLTPARVISIDIHNERLRMVLPQHPAITYFSGSSTDAGIFAAVQSQRRADDRVMVPLDSDHSEAHVRAELELYAPLVSSGCYLIVEDTNVNGHPVYPRHGPGPFEAVCDFRPAHPEFEVDRMREKFMLTFNPNGYLRRK